MVTRQEITSGLRDLGLNIGDDVVVHSSLKSFGRVEGGADAVIDALLDVVGLEGTLLVPTSVFRGSLTEHLRRTTEIDLRTAPSMLGAITETLRRRTGAIRSIHASHPVAGIGARALELLADHHRGDATCGEFSPYGKLASRRNGRVLMLGVTTASMTLLHTAEEYYTPYVFNGEVYTVRVHPADDSISSQPTHDVRVKGYCIGQPRDFPALDPFLQAEGYLHRGQIGDAVVTLLDAPGVLKTAREKIRENPNFLLASGREFTAGPTPRPLA